VRGPSACVQGPSAGMRGPSAHLRRPSARVRGPSACAEPSARVQRLFRWVRDRLFVSMDHWLASRDSRLVLLSVLNVILYSFFRKSVLLNS